MYHGYTTQLLDGVQGTAGANKKAQEKKEQHAHAVGDYDLILCKKQYIVEGRGGEECGGWWGGEGAGRGLGKKNTPHHLTKKFCF